MRSHALTVSALAVVLVAGAILSCKDVFRSSADLPPVPDPMVCFSGQLMSLDEESPKVFGHVYFYAQSQNGAIVHLCHENGECWYDTSESSTQGDGWYDIRCKYSGWYRIRAGFHGENSLSWKFYIRPHSFDQAYIDLCIGYRDPSPDDH